MAALVHLADLARVANSHTDGVPCSQLADPTDDYQFQKDHSYSTRGVQMNFALGYLASAHLRFYLLVSKSDPLNECEYTL